MVKEKTDYERNRTESISVVDKLDMLKKRDSVRDDDVPSDNVDKEGLPVQMVSGEQVLFHGLTSDGQIIITTYRLFFNHGTTFAVIPKGLIGKVETKECLLILYCKDGKMEYCLMKNKEACLLWKERLVTELQSPSAVIDTFAFAYYVTQELKCKNKEGEERLMNGYGRTLNDEIKRQKIDLKKTWRITNINDNFQICGSYPRELIVPRSFDDEQKLQNSAQFRMKSRFPCVTWRNQDNGAVLLRCSQPSIGWGKRCEEDEQLITAVIEACNMKSLKIVDARSWLAAAGNCVWNNGGYETDTYYEQCSIVYQNLPNIHAVRTSFNAVRDLCTKDSASWLTALEGSKWLTNLCLLMEAAQVCVESLTHESCPEPVLVHCSDGWDRTPQIVALTEMMLDPFYRTFEGFEYLVQREWISFGHKFADRCGNVINSSVKDEETCPIFIQWLDAVFQFTNIYPSAFEFNESYLMKLAHHVYSGMFGDFLHNNLSERQSREFSEDTASIWWYLKTNRSDFRNELYNPNNMQRISRTWHVRDLKLWTNLYISPRTPNCELFNDSMETSSLSLSRRAASETDLSSIDDLSSSQTNLHNKMGGSVQSGLSVGTPEGTRSRHGSKTSLKDPNGVTSTNNSNTNPSQRRLREVRHFSKMIGSDGISRSVLTADRCLKRVMHAQDERIKQLENELNQLKKLKDQNFRMHPALQAKLTASSPKKRSAGDSSSGESDGSWDCLPHENKMTLWVPDHHATHCSGCNSQFSRLFRRKHHCRNCGHVFCHDCASNFAPIPEQYLYEAVRICTPCSEKLFNDLDEKMQHPDDIDIDILAAGQDPDSQLENEILAHHAERTSPRHLASDPIDIPLPSTSPQTVVSCTNRAHTARQDFGRPAQAESAFIFKTCSKESITDSLENLHLPPSAKCK